MLSAVRILAAGQAVTGPCTLHGYTLRAGAGATATVVLYDNTAATGDAIASASCIQDTFVGFSLGPAGVACGKGIYVSGAGAGFQCTVYYSK